MTVTALAVHRPAAVRDALVRRGVEPVRAEATAAGLRSVALILEPLAAEEREAVLHAARARGVECVTGPGWALLAGGVAQLAGLTRPGALAPELAAPLGQRLSGLAGSHDQWLTARGPIGLARPVVVGILNITPDSFSDGGRYLAPDEALRHADELLAAGADLLDIGAESTRPGRPEPVSAEEEWRRLGPVLAELARRHPEVPLSVDTAKVVTARRALDAGAWIVNDVSGLRLDPAIADACAEAEAGLVLMHSRGTLRDMATYDHAVYQDVASEVALELEQSMNAALGRGVSPSRIVLDPGLGFAKRPEHNFQLLQRLETIAALGCPVMVGPSRKRFLEVPTGQAVAGRDPATAAACVAAYAGGAMLFRVHDVHLVREALNVAHAVSSA